MTRSRFSSVAAVAAGVALTMGAFSGAAQAQQMRGNINIDGSSTVYPITQKVAEMFNQEQPNVKIAVDFSGTGGGFKKFIAGTTDISDASRPIKPSEAQGLEDAGIEFIELPVAYDGLTVVVNPKNTAVKQLTVDQLKKIFLGPDPAKKWSDVDPSWPNEEIVIYSPGTASGTYDYFNEVVAGKEGKMRTDMNLNEDDNVLVRGVSGNPNAIGFFGVAYYEENKDALKAVPIVNKEGKAVSPTLETIESGEYNPFSRPLFIYVNAQSAKRPEVKAFVNYYLAEAADVVGEVGYAPLPRSIYTKAKSNFRKGDTGSDFLKDGENVEGSLTELYQ